MPHVKAPNGDVYDLPDATASGLVNSKDSGWEYAEDPESKSTAKKSSSAKK